MENNMDALASSFDTILTPAPAVTTTTPTPDTDTTNQKGSDDLVRILTETLAS